MALGSPEAKAPRKPRTINPVTAAVREWEKAVKRREIIEDRFKRMDMDLNELAKDKDEAIKAADTAWAALQALQGKEG
jgi:hypothetical protein